MINFKYKLILLIIVLVLGIISIQTSICAANDNSVIVKKSETEYMVYIKEYLDEEFEFAFSDNKDELKENLTFIDSALDMQEENANNIAYINTATPNTTYLWIKQNDEIRISAREIDINDNVLKTDLEKVGDISNIIPVKLEQKIVEDITTEEGLRKTTTVGNVKITNSFENLQYQLIKRPQTGADNDLFALAELIEKNEFTDAYTKIKASKEFLELYNQQYSTLDAQKWLDVQNEEILQPEEAQTGDQYILWLKSGNYEDVHFLTSNRAVDEEWVKEEIKTTLPYTYDNNTILIAFGVVIIAIILVAIRIKMLSKKEMEK